jgi:hypothetical protein
MVNSLFSVLSNLYLDKRTLYIAYSDLRCLGSLLSSFIGKMLCP